MYRKYIIIVLGNLYVQAFDRQAFGIQVNIIRQSDIQAFLVQVNGSVTNRIHAGKTDYKCMSCGRSFLLSGDLKRHIHTTHEGHKDYKCESCEK